jgi:hypothetical protein
MLLVGKVAELINEAHESQVKRVACRVHALTKPARSFSMTAKAATLAGCGAIGKACELAFFYGTESDPKVASTFLAKITKSILHEHVPVPHESIRPRR